MRRGWMVLPLLMAAWSLAGPWLAPMLAQPAAGKKYALLVGVSHYRTRGLTPLEYAAKDVSDFAAVLKRAGYEVTLLTEEAATKDAVEAALDALLGRQEGDAVIRGKISGRQDLVLVALSGHGVQMEAVERIDGKDSRREIPFFCPVDSVADQQDSRRLLPGTLVNLNALVRRLHRAGGGNNLLLVDACRDDPTKPRSGSRGGGVDGSAIENLPNGTAILFACSQGERAFESDKAGGGHGVFFHAVLEAFAGKGATERGEVTWQRLAGHVTEVVGDRVKEWVADDKRQQPNLMGNTSGKVVLAAPDAMEGTEAGQARTFAGMPFRWCPKGMFRMGDGKDGDNKPVDVTLTKGFWMAETELTKAQWKAVVIPTPWQGKQFVKDDDDTPATHVSHDDAVAYCKMLTRAERDVGRLPSGWVYKLPTEAQWEYACRAGTTTEYSFAGGEENLGDFAWFNKNAWDIDAKYAHKVGTKAANPWGLSDMHGNVYEWCEDWYADKLPGGTDPVNTTKATFRVDRGGSWNDGARSCRSANRFRYSPVIRNIDLGFRLAISSKE